VVYFLYLNLMNVGFRNSSCIIIIYYYYHSFSCRYFKTVKFNFSIIIEMKYRNILINYEISNFTVIRLYFYFIITVILEKIYFLHKFLCCITINGVYFPKLWSYFTPTCLINVYLYMSYKCSSVTGKNILETFTLQ
jgi:hypothetical protein